MSEQTPDVKKSIEAVVEQILEQEKKQDETPAAVIEKSIPVSTEANGGATAAIVDPTAPKVEEAPAEVEKAKKDDDCDDDKDDKKKKAKKDDKKDDKDDKKPAFMKKSIEELAAVLDEEELELIKAWRDETPAEEITKSTEAAQAPATEETKEEEGEDLAKSLAKAIDEQLAPLKKSLDEKDSLIKSMSEKIEKMASQPAYDRRSISSLETIEKSGADNGAETLTKSQVAEKMLGMQLAGKGVTSHHISEFEATGNISDPQVKALVFKELKLN